MEAKLLKKWNRFYNQIQVLKTNLNDALAYDFDALSVSPLRLKPDEYTSLLRLNSKARNGKIGSIVAHEVKRIKSDYITYKITQNLADFDITPTLAGHIIFEIFGRKISNRTLIKLFAESGRTASNKTQNTLEDFADFIKKEKAEYKAFMKVIDVIRTNIIKKNDVLNSDYIKLKYQD